MPYLQLAHSELLEFSNSLRKQIDNAEFTDPVVQRYWTAVASAAHGNLDALIKSQEQLRIRNAADYKAFQAAIERATFFLAASVDDDLAKASWLIRASRTVTWRLIAMNLLPEEARPESYGGSDLSARTKL